MVSAAVALAWGPQHENTRNTECTDVMPIATTINMISVIPAVTATRSTRRACTVSVMSASGRPAAIMTDRLERSVQGGFYEGRQGKEHSVSEMLPGDHMIDAESRANKRQQGQRAVELHVAARLENLAMLRTLVGAIGTFEDLDFDAVADLRLAVDEVCTRLIRSATPDATLSSSSIPRDDELVVEASAACDTARRGGTGQLQLARPDFARRRRADLPRRARPR